MSLCGLGRFPRHALQGQWTKLLDMVDEIHGFLRAHEAELKTKEPKWRGGPDRRKKSESVEAARRSRIHH